MNYAKLGAYALGDELAISQENITSSSCYPYTLVLGIARIMFFLHSPVRGLYELRMDGGSRVLLVL